MQVVTESESRISARNQVHRGMLLEARHFRAQGRPFLAEVIEAEAAEYRGLTLEIMKKSGMVGFFA